MQGWRPWYMRPFKHRQLQLVHARNKMVFRLFFTRKWRRLCMITASSFMIAVVLRLVYLSAHNEESIGIPQFSYSDGESRTSKTVLACQYPNLLPWDKTMLKFFKPHPPLRCDALGGWVEVIDGRFVIKLSAVAKFGDIACKYNAFGRVHDENTTEANEVAILNNTKIPCDFFRVTCTSTSGATYSNIQAGIQYNEAIHNRLKNTKPSSKGIDLDIVIIGFDSVSRMQFMRKLPESYKYLTDALGGIVLKGYNIVGDGTPQALIPLLTGKTERELPNVLKRKRSRHRVDVYPFIWRHLSEHGYATAWSEDAPSVGTFTYRMNGFEKQPTDHYMRTFHNKDDWKNKPKHCIGDRPRVRVVFDWIKDFLKMYKSKPKFAFMFHNELSHGHNDLIQTADSDLKNLLKFLHADGHLDRSMFILMADHGARFPEQRTTLQGKQEERNPFFSFVLPSWFKEQYPEAYSNFVKNSERLVTPFDIHATMMDVVQYQSSVVSTKEQRSISLFNEIPPDRSCHSADIEPHWCNCLYWMPVDILDYNAVTGANALVKYMNQMTLFQRNNCVELNLFRCLKVVSFYPTPEMLRFKKSKDINGLKPDMTSDTHMSYRLFQMKIETIPNKGLYEATFKQDIETGKFSFNEDDISRINRYGKDPHCIQETHEQLRKYCLCRDRLSSHRK